MMPRDFPVGLVGVGRMGANMARRLKECGFLLTSVFDQYHPAALALSSELQTPAVHSPAEVALHAVERVSKPAWPGALRRPGRERCI